MPPRPPSAFEHLYTHAQGARPVAPMPTTETGFLGVLTLSELVLRTAEGELELLAVSPHAEERLLLQWDTELWPLFGEPGPHPLRVSDLQRALLGRARPVRGTRDLEAWREELAEELLHQLLLLGLLGERAAEADEQRRRALSRRARELWDELAPGFRRRWQRWLRRHTGMQRLELALLGYFENGGEIAHVSVALQGPPSEDEDLLPPAELLAAAFGGARDLAMLCAPGLSPSWQQAVLDYAGPRGRGDLFAIVDGPPVPGSELSTGPYAVAPLPSAAEPRPMSVRDAAFRDFPVRDTGGFGAAFGPWLIVDNPASLTPEERYVMVPPSGHVAGAIGAADRAPGGGVHAPLSSLVLLGVTEPAIALAADQLRAMLRSGVNPIVRRPRAGVRVAGELSLARDPRWSRVGVRRTWLLVARSLREGLRWAAHARGPARARDVHETIAGFLDQLHRQGLLEGATPEEAWTIEETAEGTTVWIRPVGAPERLPVAVRVGR